MPFSSSTTSIEDSDLREAFVTVKREFMRKQNDENMTLKTTNSHIKEQNTQLAQQNDKLKRLCHLCLHLIIFNNDNVTASTTSLNEHKLDQNNDHGQGHQQHQQHDDECVSIATTEDIADHHSNDSSSSDVSIVGEVDVEIDRLILEYLYTGSNGSTDSSSSQRNLVEHFDKLISRLMTAASVVACGDESTKMSPHNNPTHNKLKVNHSHNPQIHHKRKRSIINRILVKASSLSSFNQKSRKAKSAIQPTPSLISLASSATDAANHLHVAGSIQKLHEFFEGQQENNRDIPGVDENGAGTGQDSDKTVTNAHHLVVAPIKSMTGGIGSPFKSMIATEEHSGSQLSSNIVAQDIVDTSPKMSEVAMFCGLNENQTNQILNYAVRKENEKRQRQLEELRVKEKLKTENEENANDDAQNDGLSDDFEVILPPSPQPAQSKHIFSISTVGSYSTEEEEDEGDAADSVVGDTISNGSGCLIEDQQTMEQEMDRLLQHLHQHKWFVFPGEAATSQDIVNQLTQDVFDLNNIEAAFQAIHRLWQSRRFTTSRLVFFYQMFTFLFDKYINVLFCDCHQPPCVPSVEASLFGKIAIPILKQFLKCINPNNHMVIQMELLTAIESIVYNRPHYRPALSEIFHQLFVYGVVETVAFSEWSDLQDPSAHFEAVTMSQQNSKGRSERSPSSESTKSTIIKSKSKSNFQCTSPTTPNGSSPAQEKLTNRERLFQELNKSGFRLFKSKSLINV